ncbi:MAG: sigma-54-dependent Fis family transcriptional regulator [Spirochaetales bacterium]|nr:sigma-54-dependent Fis family transcriptional regulator [Candidatus Physcosoma equi]
MLYNVFADDRTILDLLSPLLEKNEKIELHPLSSILDAEIREDEVALVYTSELNTVHRLYQAMKHQTHIVAIVKNGNLSGDILFHPQISVLKEPLKTDTLHKAFENLRYYKKMNAAISCHVAGKSSSMQALRDSIILASRKSYPIHLSGETGTGKTLAARLIHHHSGLRKKLVYINCANLNSSLSDSDLFGHIKGSFTNAAQSRQGLLERANESTLFLDEIGDLPEEIQGKLLDTIENGFYRSIGSDEEKHSSFRLITAGQQSLDKLLEMKKLRKDFYYRISNVHVEIAPLREHLEDIPDIVENYERNNRIQDCRIDDYRSLMYRTWPGNVRELIHHLDRIHMNLSTDKPVDED